MPQVAQSLAAVMPEPGADVEVRELPIPQLEPDSALMKVELSEVCGTDVYLKEGRLAEVPYPIIPGHVSVGTIEKIRGTLTDVDGYPFAEGDRITFLDVHRTCHQCWYCTVAQASTRCPHRKVYGITYGIEDGLTGGWSEYLYLKPGIRAIRMNGVPSDAFMAGGCSLPTALHAVERADIRLADSVLILGSGPVGLSAIAFAAMRGSAQVLCIGAPEHRLRIAATMGANATLNFAELTEEQRLEWVRQKTAGRGADVTIECTGNPVAVAQALRFTRDAGSVCIVGQYTDHGDVTINPHLDLNKKHLDVKGCWGSDYSHFHRAVEVLRMERAKDRWSAVSLERYSLTQANDALAAVKTGEAVKALIIPTR